MVDTAQILQTAGTSVLNSLLPQQAPAAPQVIYTPAAAKPINWLLWGGIALGAVAGLLLLKKTMSKGGSAPAAAPAATNPRRRRKVKISRRRR